MWLALGRRRRGQRSQPVSERGWPRWENVSHLPESGMCFLLSLSLSHSLLCSCLDVGRYIYIRWKNLSFSIERQPLQVHWASVICLIYCTCNCKQQHDPRCRTLPQAMLSAICSDCCLHFKKKASAQINMLQQLHTSITLLEVILPCMLWVQYAVCIARRRQLHK